MKIIKNAVLTGNFGWLTFLESHDILAEESICETENITNRLNLGHTTV